VKARGCILTGLGIAGIGLVLLIAFASVGDPLGFLLSVAAASVPALLYAGLVLRLDRYEIEPMRAVLASFGWGAVGAILFSIVAELVFQFAAVDRYGVDRGAFVGMAFGAPLIEETFKGLALLALLFMWRDELDSVLDGLVYGALVGVGFAMTENIIYFGSAYQEGFREFGLIIFARAVLSGLGHPAYTAVTGAAVGWSRSQYGQGITRFVVPVLGWGIAVALHIAWNGGLALTSYLMGPSRGLVEVVAVQTLIVIVPAVLVLYAIARISSRHELQVLRDELRPEVALGTISEEEYRTIIDAGLRRDALAAAAAKGGRTLRGTQQAFFQTSAELAFRNHHRRRGDRHTPVHDTRDHDDRQRLLDLRRELTRNLMVG
jgi:RsiW-degrading membrane proteinase PrsW (M82 family)